MKITGLDHFVLTVSDIDTSCDFYRKILGLEVVVFGDNRKALIIGDQKINLHQAGRELQPCAERPVPGSADICLITDTDIAVVEEQLAASGIAIELGPVERTGVHGAMTSVYFRDPDGNLLEVSRYP